MCDMEAELEECKASIRGILTSASYPLTVNQLYRDHQDLAGDIPLRQFGYRSLHQFLLSIPDTVRLAQPHDSNSIVHPVQTRETQHISKLVQEQKKPSKKPGRSSYRPGNNRRFQYRRNPITYDFRRDVYRFIERCPQSSVDIRELENHVKTLQYKHSLLDYEFQEILSRLSDIIDVHHRIVSLKSPQIVRERISPGNWKRSPHRNRDVINLADEESDQSVDEMNEFVLIDDDSSSEICERGTPTDRRRCTSRTSSLDGDATSIHPDDFGDENPLISNALVENLRALLDDKENANGIWMTDLSRKYSLKFGYSLQPESHGFQDVLDMVAHMNNVFVTKKYRQEGDFLLLDARKHRLEHKEETEGEITQTFLNELKRMLQRNKQLYADELKAEYRRMYQKTLRPEDYGFKSEDSFLKTLSESSNDIIFRTVRNRSLILLNVCPSEELTTTNSQRSEDDEILGSYRINPFPKEVCGPDFKLEPDHFVDDLTPGQKFPVVMGEIYSPGKFFVQLKENEQLLNMMMDDLHEFYTANEKEYEILSSALVTRGLLCACPYSGDSRWHRVRIVNSRLTRAKASFVDYGTMEDVEVGKLRYLHKDFAKHPPLCLRARLAGIGPKKTPESAAANSYGKAVCNRFFALTRPCNGELTAELVKYDVNSQCLDIILWLALNETTDLSISQKLLEEDVVERRDIDEIAEAAIPVMDPILEIEPEPTRRTPVDATERTNTSNTTSSSPVMNLVPIFDAPESRAMTPSGSSLPSFDPSSTIDPRPSGIPRPSFVPSSTIDSRPFAYMNGTTEKLKGTHIHQQTEFNPQRTQPVGPPLGSQRTEFYQQTTFNPQKTQPVGPPFGLQRTEFSPRRTQPLGPPPGLTAPPMYRPPYQHPYFNQQMNPLFMGPEFQYPGYFGASYPNRIPAPMMPTASPFQYQGPVYYQPYSNPNPPAPPYPVRPSVGLPPGIDVSLSVPPMSATPQPCNTYRDRNNCSTYQKTTIPADKHGQECNCGMCPSDAPSVANRKRDLANGLDRHGLWLDDDFLQRVAKQYARERELRRNRERVESEDEEEVISRPASARRSPSVEDTSNEYVDRGNMDARERLAVENKLKEYLGKGGVDNASLENLHISTSRVSRSSSRSTGSSIDLRSESAAVSAFTEESVYAQEFVPTQNSTTVNGVSDPVVNGQRNSLSTSKSPSEMSKLSKLNPIKDFVLKHSKNINHTS